MKKTLIILLTLAFLMPLALGNAEVLLQDDFNDGDYSGWTHIVSADQGTLNGEWTIQEVNGNKVLQGVSWGDAQDIQLDNFQVPQSFILEFDTKMIYEGTGASLVGWYTHRLENWTSWIGHGYKPGRFYIDQVVNGSYVSTPDNYFYFPSEVDPTEWHHIEYIEEGTKCTLKFDGYPVYENYNLPVQLTNGHLVLAVGANSTQQFDNVIIRTLETPPSLEERVNTLEQQLEELQQRLKDCPTTKHCIPEE